MQKYAMQFGTYMGVYWIFKFGLFPLGFTNQFFFFAFFVLTLAVPFLGYRYAKTFRDRVCRGSLNFMQSWIFMVFMYMFAALLTAMAHYIYFRFIDNGYIVDQYLEMLNTVFAQMPEFETMSEQLIEGVKAVGNLSPIEMVMQLLSTNFLYCSIISLITAPFLMKKQSITS